MFFLGIERREPSREREEMKRRIGRIKGEFTSNVGLQFRIQTLNARSLSYERMWLRGAGQRALRRVPGGEAAVQRGRVALLVRDPGEERREAGARARREVQGAHRGVQGGDQGRARRAE